MTTGVDLLEWETRNPADSDVLKGRFLGASTATSRLVHDLQTYKLLGLDELREGLRVRAFSHVGRVRVGDLQVTVRPKIERPSLLNLLRYAYGFRKLRLLSEADQAIESCGFEDLLISQLNAETREILTRGVQRTYVSQSERLASPRGRIDVDEVARAGGTVGATLPCRHFPRVQDTPLNRVLLAGLKLAASMATDLGLARDAHRLADLLEEQVTRIRLTTAALAHAEGRVNRLTATYAPAISIIRLLVESSGVILDDRTESLRLPGFLFDMNAFFQALIGRFLLDNLPGYEIISEYRLKHMMRYTPGFNPLQRKSPTPRPDYVLKQGRKVVAILDAKYRDLWEKPLPREMLYQLAVYAISHRDQPRSAIIYPTANRAAREQRIDISDPVHGSSIGQVCLRPVNLADLEATLAAPSPAAARHRAEIAKRLALPPN